MTAYLRPALRQTRLFSRSGLTRHLGLLYRTVQPTIVLFLLVLALTGCLSEDIPTEKETTLVRVGEKAPHFTVGMLDDTAITLSDLQGNVVLLTFFSTWCPTCREQMQQMQTQIVDRFADRKFRFLPINRGETQQTVQEFCRELGIVFSVGLDPDMSIYSLYATPIRSPQLYHQSRWQNPALRNRLRRNNTTPADRANRTSTPNNRIKHHTRQSRPHKTAVYD